MTDLLPKNRYFRLLADMNHGVSTRRRSALEELGGSGDPRSPGPMTRRLFDSDPSIRELSAQFLDQHGLGAVGSAVLGLYREGPTGRGSAVALFADLLENPMPAPHVAVIASTAVGLHELYDVVAVAGVQHDDRYVRRAAVEGLYQVNQPALAPVFVLPSTDSDAGVRRYAAVGMAENSLFFGAGRLCRDSVKSVSKAARAAFSRPGEPQLVRDTHRRVMEKSSAFCLPDCGSAHMAEQDFPSLMDVSIELAKTSRDPVRLGAAVVTLLMLGRRREEISGYLPLDAPDSVRRRVASPERRDCEQARSPALSKDLTGFRLLLVGGDGLETSLLDKLHDTGLAVEWISGFDNAASRLNSSGFDAVLILTRRVSHAVADHAVRIGERCEAVVVHVPGLGRDTVLDAAREALL